MGEDGTPAAGGWHVYLLRCADGSLYTGITTDLARRVAEHNEGRGARYTRGRLPAQLVYAEAAADRAAAQRREYAIRRLPAAGKRRLLTAGDSD
ncbi:MAG TPA: GIY-YIG nuclease family protein [Woeseiaceae bacterium]|nr:GIY-YIG nuclease family protein [Woeseiaceae bacterium]